MVLWLIRVQTIWRLLATCTNYYCTCCLYGGGRNYFDASKFHYKGHWKGWALKSRFFGPEMATIKILKIKTFLGPEMATSATSAMYLLCPSLLFQQQRVRKVTLRTCDPPPLPTVLLLWQGGGGVNQREGQRSNISQSWIENTNLTDSISSL